MARSRMDPTPLPEPYRCCFLRRRTCRPRADGRAVPRADCCATSSANGSATSCADSRAASRTDGRAILRADYSATSSANDGATSCADGRTASRTDGRAIPRADCSATSSTNDSATSCTNCCATSSGEAGAAMARAANRSNDARAATPSPPTPPVPAFDDMSPSTRPLHACRRVRRGPHVRRGRRAPRPRVGRLRGARGSQTKTAVSRGRRRVASRDDPSSCSPKRSDPPVVTQRVVPFTVSVPSKHNHPLRAARKDVPGCEPSRCERVPPPLTPS